MRSAYSGLRSTEAGESAARCAPAGFASDRGTAGRGAGVQVHLAQEGPLTSRTGARSTIAVFRSHRTSPSNAWTSAAAVAPHDAARRVRRSPSVDAPVGLASGAAFEHIDLQTKKRLHGPDSASIPHRTSTERVSTMPARRSAFAPMRRPACHDLSRTRPLH